MGSTECRPAGWALRAFECLPTNTVPSPCLLSPPRSRLTEGRLLLPFPTVSHGLQSYWYGYAGGYYFSRLAALRPRLS
jgi:hypothetical protein